MADQIRVNNVMMSWGSITLKTGVGEPFRGFNEISYGDKRERVKAYGMGRHHAPRGRSGGKYTVDPVKLKGPKGTVQAFRNWLATQAPDGISIGNVEFPIHVMYVDTGDEPMDVLVEGCALAADASNHSESPDPLMDDIELDCMRIWRNGLALFDATEGAP
jgi:hypothetical protein